jgi:hypothetical protein
MILNEDGTDKVVYEASLLQHGHGFLDCIWRVALEVSAA